MKKLYSEGIIGSLNYADCSYFAAYRGTWIPFCKHKFEWRNWMPQSYYSSHVVGPLLFATGLRPVAVSGLESPNSKPSRSIGKLTATTACSEALQRDSAAQRFFCPRSPRSCGGSVGQRDIEQAHRRRAARLTDSGVAHSHAGCSAQC
jgi:hypothetical protein